MQAVNNTEMRETKDLDRITREPTRAWRITILRGGQQLSVTFSG